MRHIIFVALLLVTTPMGGFVRHAQGDWIYKKPCLGDRVIGLLSKEAAYGCDSQLDPTEFDWAVKPLFSNKHAGLPARLKRYCLYNWVGKGRPDPGILRGLHPSAKFGPSCPVVKAQWVPTGTAASALSTSFVLQNNLPYFAESPLEHPLGEKDRAEVLILDTSPDERLSGLPTGGLQGHGEAVASLVARASYIFENGLPIDYTTELPIDHAADVRFIQALPQPYDEVVGRFGSHDDVTTALDKAISWVDHHEDQKIIVNLSIGWDQNYTGTTSPLPIADQAIFDAIQFLSCLDVLVLAASGNLTSSHGGPVAPAAWASKRLKCNGVELNEPLLYAVGAVDGADRPLALAAPDAQPALVVPGVMVSIPVSRSLDEGHFDVMSGTSVGPPTVAGLASLIWALEPGLSRKRVMKFIYTSSVDLWRTADFSLDPPENEHRLDACTTISNVCAQNCTVVCPVMRPANDPQHPLSTEVFSEYPAVLSEADTPRDVEQSTLDEWEPPPASGEPMPSPAGSTCCPSPHGSAGLWAYDGAALIGYLEPPAVEYVDQRTSSVTSTAATVDMTFVPTCSAASADLCLPVTFSGLNLYEEFRLTPDELGGLVETALVEVRIPSDGVEITYLSEVAVLPGDGNP
ncbi:MAG: S8/S53 family peptidase [Myxococcales bacterium]|nr:S8/S53 family peptidase [Myxococcales bacterium]